LIDFANLVAHSLLLTRSEAIIAADRDGIIRFWNPGAERIFGYIRDDAIGRSLDLIIPERLQQRQLFQKRGENALVVVAAAMVSVTGITE